ncbi:MAG: DUF3634 family protein [Myxococcota bacterium]
MGSSSIVLAVVALATAAIAFKLVRGGIGSAVFIVTVRGEGVDGVHVQGTVPGKTSSDMQDFVARMELPVGAKIWAVRDGDGVRLRFNAKVPDNLQQRTRNFIGT